MSMNPQKEKADLLNMHKFIGKHIEMLTNTAIEAFANNSEIAPEKIDEHLQELISKYPKQLKGVTLDFYFYSQIMKHTSAAIILLNIEQQLKNGGKPSPADSIEEGLKELLGF